MLWKQSPSCYVCTYCLRPLNANAYRPRALIQSVTAYRPRALTQCDCLPAEGPTLFWTAWTGKYMCSTTTKYNIQAAWADANTYCSARRFVTYSFSLELLVWCMASNKNSEHSYRLDIWLVQQKDKVSGQLELKQIHIALQDSLFLQGLSARVEVEIDM